MLVYALVNYALTWSCTLALLRYDSGPVFPGKACETLKSAAFSALPSLWSELLRFAMQNRSKTRTSLTR